MSYLLTAEICSFQSRLTIRPNTHNRFTALFDFIRDYPGEPAAER